MTNLMDDAAEQFGPVSDVKGRIITRLLQMLDTQCVKLDLNLTNACLPAKVFVNNDEMIDVRQP